MTASKTKSASPRQSKHHEFFDWIKRYDPAFKKKK
jgi:hypothetical protein